MATRKTIRVYEVLADTAGPGSMGDGLNVFRFSSYDEAKAFADANTCYGKMATVTATDAPKAIANRWGFR